MYPTLPTVEPPVVLRPGYPPEPPGPSGRSVVWDVDGTLVRGDTLLPYLRRFVAGPELARIVLDSVVRSGRSPAEAGRRSGAKAAVLQRVLCGREFAEADAEARAYVAGTVMRWLRPDCLRRWQWHRTRGDRMILASASLGLYLDHLGVVLGAHRVISTRMEVVNGRLTGQLATPNCRGVQKARLLCRDLDEHPVRTVWAYGNSGADRAMLDLADVAIRVRPYRPLRTVR